MMTEQMRNNMGSSMWRIALAVVLIMVGLAPVGVPILSDSSLRQSIAGSNAVNTQPFTYRLDQSSDASAVQRSADNGATWQSVTVAPVHFGQIVATGLNNGLVFARGDDAIWRSSDAGMTWSKTTPLSSRPQALGVEALTGEQMRTNVGNREPVMVVGTESLGLFTSQDRGITWQAAGSGLAGPNPGAAVGISAVAVSPDDPQVLYAAPGYYLGTSHVTFNPAGATLSTDGGRTWFQMTGPDPLTLSPIETLLPIPGRPLALAANAGKAMVNFDLAASPTFAEGLTTGSPTERAAVARAIGLSGNRLLLPALMAHLGDVDQLAGDAAAWAVGKLGDTSVVPQLMLALNDTSEMVRGRAATALGLLKTEAAVPQLTQMLDNDGATARQAAAVALAEIHTPAALNALVVGLADASMTPRREASMNGLERAGVAATPQLVTALASGDATVRRNAAEMLGWSKPIEATGSLAQALSDRDVQVRTEAAWALGEIGTTRAGAAVQTALGRETDPLARQVMQQSLVQVALAQRQDNAGAETLATRLSNALSMIPVSRWTFLGLLTLLAVLVLVTNRRQLHLGRR
jgi:HEAT repeat protein